MIIQQLSVFLENKSGRRNEILDILGKANIRIIAATVADTSEYGILRLITSDTAHAIKLLKEANVSANTSDVIALTCDSMAGTFAKELKYFAKESISIEYMYCFSKQTNAFLIIRTSNQHAALETIKKYGLHSITEKELIEL